MIAAGIGALSCLIWVVLIAGWGRFWRISTTTDGLTLHPGLAPRVAVVVAARDEADVIGQAVRSLLEQVYPGPLHIFVVDDHSTGDTSLRSPAARRMDRKDVGAGAGRGARGRVFARVLFVHRRRHCAWSGQHQFPRRDGAGARSRYGL